MNSSRNETYAWYYGSHSDKRDPAVTHCDRGSRGSGRLGGRVDRWYRSSRGFGRSRLRVLRSFKRKKTCGFGRDKRKKKPQTVLFPERPARVFMRTFLTGSHAGTKRLLGVRRRFGLFHTTIHAATTTKRHKIRIVGHLPGCCARCVMAVGHLATLFNCKNTRGFYKSESVCLGINVMKTPVPTDSFFGV